MRVSSAQLRLFEPPERTPRQRTRRAVSALPSPNAHGEGPQLYLLPPSIMRRQVVRRLTVFRYVRLGLPVTRVLHETIPCVLPTSADDQGLPDAYRWTPPRHAKTFDTLPYEEDYEIRRFVLEHPEGASLGEIAAAIGWSKQGLLDVERRAMRKLVKLAFEDDGARQWMADVLGLDVEDIRDALSAWTTKKGQPS